MAQQGLQQILHSSCFKVVKKKQVKQKCEVKKIKSPFFPTKSENRFLSSDIVYLWKKILIHEKEHLDPWELISSKYLRNNFSFYSVLNGYGAPAVCTPCLGSRARPGGGWAHLRKMTKKSKRGWGSQRLRCTGCLHSGSGLARFARSPRGRIGSFKKKDKKE